LLPVDLNSALGITPFATLPYYDTMAERRGLHLRQVAKVFIVLLVLGLLAWAVNRYYMPLDLLLDRLIGRFALVNGSLPDRV
jgi:hypothetical protein